jgi:hypothetical protein
MRNIASGFCFEKTTKTLNEATRRIRVKCPLSFKKAGITTNSGNHFPDTAFSLFKMKVESDRIRQIIQTKKIMLLAIFLALLNAKMRIASAVRIDSEIKFCGLKKGVEFEKIK